jgi:tryptophan synthase alpha chain
MAVGVLEGHFRARLATGKKLLVPYVTGGLTHWKEAIRVAAANGADAIEVGIPFSDPVMDGPVIQEASQRSLDAGSTPRSIITEIAALDVGIPIAVMLYYNTVFRMGHERFAALCAENGVSGAIVPDLPLEESGPWCEAADAAGVETVMLAAPTAPSACHASPRAPTDSSTPSDCWVSPVSATHWQRQRPRSRSASRP